ncbi:MAG: hypothetical protein ACE3JQ_10040 [Paenisporosarcina sp.]
MFNEKIYWQFWLGLVIGVFFLLWGIKGFNFDSSIIASALSAGGITLFVEKVVFKIFIWKWCPDIFYPWLSNIPYIGGQWEGEIQSDYIYPGTGKTGDPIPSKIEIRHDFNKICVTLETNNSYSSSYVSDVWIDEGKRKYLCYTYYNDADENRDTNPNHDGSAKLRITDGGELRLDGHYFTGRKTTGKMTFKRISKKNARA